MKYYRRKAELQNGTRAIKREKREAVEFVKYLNNKNSAVFERGYNKLLALYKRIA